MVLPIFLLLFMAIVDFGTAVFTYNSLTNASREGARLAIVNQDSASVILKAQRQVKIAEIVTPSVTINFYQQNDNGTPDTTRPCTTPVPVGCMAVVSFEATYRPLTPIIGRILFGSGVTFTAKSVETVEYSCPNPPGLVVAQCPKQP
jgi:Flp pilus assembly protein TadG